MSERNRLNQFDLVASVSGGGYPVAGLLDIAIRRNEAIKDLLNESSDYIDDVESNAKFISRIDAYLDLAIAAIFTPLELITKPLYSGSLLKAASGNYVYQLKIARTFAGRVFWSMESKLSRAGRVKDFPYPIFIASSNFGNAPDRGHTYSANDVFELTPEWAGGEAVGYFSVFPSQSDISIGDAIAISAAAIDTPGGDDHDEVINQTLRKLGLALGGAVWLPGHNWIYVADGGFIENQAVLPLVRRGCKRILALDAGSDPDAKFDGWDKLTNYVRVAGGSMLPLSSANATSVDSAFSGWQLPAHVWKSEIILNQSLSELWVMKLGLMNSPSVPYPETVINFRDKNALDREFGAGVWCINPKKLSEKCLFPLQSTMVQSFTPEEFRAYRHLGKYLAEVAQNELFPDKTVIDTGQ